MAKEAVGEVDLDAIVCLDDMERAAQRVMDRQDFDYFAGGARPVTFDRKRIVDPYRYSRHVRPREPDLPLTAIPDPTTDPGAETESTLRANRAAFSRVTFWPRCMVDVSDVDTTTHVPALGLHNLAAPLLIAPVAMQRAAHPDGECAAARACAAHSIPYCASQQSTTAIEEIGRAGGDAPRMFQLYVLSDREATTKLIRRAESMGATALCITVDAPVLGRRERDVRNRFELKAGLKLANVDAGKNQNKSQDQTGPDKSAVDAKRAQSAIARRIGGRDASLTWDHLRWLRSVTRLPLVLKGIVTYADAARAVKEGVDGVWVSNHGGRQLDGSPATLDALPEVVAGVNGAGGCVVIFDGGVRRGTDALKALALGADLVAVGRPAAWGLACGGERGVGKAVELLTEELRTAMTLAGCGDVRSARNRELVQVVGETPPRSRL